MGGFLKNKKLIFIVLFIVFAAAAALSAVYFFSGAKSARDFYFKAESKNYRLYADWVKKNYAGFMDKQQPYLNSEYKSRTELTAGVTSSDAKPFGINNAKGLFDILGRCKLIIDSKYGPTSKTSLSEVSLLLEKTPFADASVFTNGRRMYLTVPVLTPDRYFTLDMDKFDEVYDRFGIPVKPQKIVGSSEIAKTLKYDGDQLDKGMTALGDFITGIIADSDVKYGKDTLLEISKEKVKAREVFVRLDGKKSSELVRGLAQRYAADRTLVELTFGNAAGVSKLLDQTGLFRLFEYLDKTGASTLNDSERKLLAAANIRSDAVSFAKSVTDTANSLDFPDGINMKLIIDRSGNILDRTLDAAITDIRTGNTSKTSIHTGATSLEFGDCRNRTAEVSVEGRDAAGKVSRSVFGIKSLFAASEGNGSDSGRIDAAWSTETGGVRQSSAVIGLDLSSVTDQATLKRTDTCKYSVELKYAGMDGSNTFNGEIGTESWSNRKLKTRDWSTNATVKASMPSFGVSDFSVSLKSMKEDKLEIGAFELPAVNVATAVDLNTATNQELTRVQDEMLASFGVFYMTNKPIIDAVLGK